MRAEQEEVLQQVAACQNLAEFEASGLDLNAAVRTLLDEPGQPRKSSKNVVKAFAKAFQATRTVQGVEASCYPQAAEMLAYATAAAPLLEPDQLVRVIALATQTTRSYAPTGLADSGESLVKVLAQYSPPRRERLVKDLWVHAHRNEWWKKQDREPLPELELDGRLVDVAFQLQSVLEDADAYNLPDAQLAEWVDQKAVEVLDTFKERWEG